MRGCSYEIDSVQGAWNTNTAYPEGNKGHRPGVKGGYFPVPPVDAFQDIRNAMCNALEELGQIVEVHHHEVATGGQCEIGVGAGTLVQKADAVQILKYAVTLSAPPKPTWTCWRWSRGSAPPRTRCARSNASATGAARSRAPRACSRREAMPPCRAWRRAAARILRTAATACASTPPCWRARATSTGPSRC